MYLSLPSLAAYLDTSPMTVRRLVDKGILPAPVVIGSMKRWDEDQVKKAIGATLEAVASGRGALAPDPDAALQNWNPKNGRKNR